jgi:5-hydroxyisourate hydrolase
MIPVISIHVLDTSRGQPAAGVSVTLEVPKPEGGWKVMGKGTTNAGGRISSVGPQGTNWGPEHCRLTFETGTYFVAQGVDHFYSEVVIHFYLADPGQHYHIPLLLSPFGYTTYLGN